MITLRIVAWVLCSLAGLVSQVPQTGPDGLGPGCGWGPLAGPTSDLASAPGPQAVQRPEATVRTEYFVLEVVPADLPVLDAPATEARELGLAQLRKRRDGDTLVLEWELRFREEGGMDTRVHQVECFDGQHHKFVWREFRPGAGRTLFVEEQLPSGGSPLDPDAPGALRSIEWGGTDGLREDLVAPPRAHFPLDLIERARSSSVRAGELQVFEALERRFQTVTLSTRLEARAQPASFGAQGTSTPPRTVELRRPDGSLAGAYRFVGAQLESFQWQAGSARGRRVPRAEWLRRHKRLDEADSVSSN